ncbi:hypothetical protein GCK72_022378 [Caenorhabditis remanei]|uniref:F-box domain-containing protein n=1 Tax=Caenorhabditis remanei TaxID=31234 RepID=A0A6A5FTL3_CAERE|nr:hypothetical protein GCK72_022378 [Caenorhabditis remanei]KAF1745930.1 hypothetical protein GCK72_022378 [Caenorhabditis remanei]
MSSPFPLFRLSEKVLKLVIQCMEYIEIIGLSLLSTKTKEIVRRLDYNIAQIDMTVEDVIRIRFNASEDNPTSLYIFSIEEIDNISFANETCVFDMSSLQDAIGRLNIHTLLFKDFCSLECAQLALRHLKSVRSVNAYCPSFDDPSQYRNILIQNLDSLVLGHEDMFLKVGLDDLLLMNSKDISIQSPTLTDKIVNQFLKHWIKGSNPRMKNAVFEFADNQVVSEEIILKGLRYREVLFDDDGVDGENEKFEGYEILRKDGTVGAISIDQSFGGYDVHFNVF